MYFGDQPCQIHLKDKCQEETENMTSRSEQWDSDNIWDESFNVMG